MNQFKYTIFLIFTICLNIYSQDYIKSLPENFLLVRLKTNEKLIQYYIKNGDVNSANREKLKIKELNNEIMSSFKKNWTLSPVYFFYSNYTEEIKKGNFKSVFHDKPNKNINNFDTNILNKKPVIVYFGYPQGKIKFDALVISNFKLEQLEKPYPKYVRTFKGLGFLKRSSDRVVNILNKKVKWYYDNK